MKVIAPGHGQDDIAGRVIGLFVAWRNQLIAKVAVFMAYFGISTGPKEISCSLHSMLNTGQLTSALGCRSREAIVDIEDIARRAFFKQEPNDLNIQ